MATDRRSDPGRIKHETTDLQGILQQKVALPLVWEMHRTGRLPLLQITIYRQQEEAGTRMNPQLKARRNAGRGTGNQAAIIN